METTYLMPDKTPSPTFLAFVEHLARQIGVRAGRGPHLKPYKVASGEGLGDNFVTEHQEFCEAWDLWVHLLHEAQHAVSLTREHLHALVQAYLHVLHEAPDLVYYAANCWLQGQQKEWLEALVLLKGKVSLDIAFRAFERKYPDRAQGVPKDDCELDHLAEAIQVPYRRDAQRLWVPDGWYPWMCRNAEDLRLPLCQGISLAVLDLDEFVREAELRFVVAQQRGISAFHPDPLGLDRVYDHAFPVLQRLEAAGFRLLFISTTPESVYQETITWLDQANLWSPHRRLLLKPVGWHGAGAVWKAHIAQQEMRRLAVERLIFGDDRPEVRETVTHALVSEPGQKRMVSTLNDIFVNSSCERQRR